MHFSRREFLEQSLLAAAAAAVAGTKLGYAEEKAVAAGPNDVLRLAVIGVNGRGGEHLSGFLKRPGCEVVAICDADETVGQTKGVNRVESTTGKKPVFYQDVRKLLENPEIDAVTIATPNHWHALGAIWAIQAGKDVYVEKPVSHNVSEGRRIVDAARKHNRICQTGTQCRSMAGTMAAIDYIRSGKIGEVKLARGLCYKGRGSIGAKGQYDVPAGIDYDLWLGPAPQADLTRPKFHYDWHWQWPYGNGDLGNQGIHQMDIARWGLGVDTIGDSVLSYGGRFGYEDAGETANTQVSIHRFGDKTLVFEVRGLKTDDLKGARVGVIFYGTKGYLALTGYEGGAAFDPEGKLVEKFWANGDHFGNFVTAVRSRNTTDLHADILEGHLSSALCHLGNISYRLGEATSLAAAKERLAAGPGSEEALETLGRFTDHLQGNGVAIEKTPVQLGLDLTLDGQAERFTGAHADKANPHLTREYRAPYVVPATADAV